MGFYDWEFCPAGLCGRHFDFMMAQTSNTYPSIDYQTEIHVTIGISWWALPLWLLPRQTRRDSYNFCMLGVLMDASVGLFCTRGSAVRLRRALRGTGCCSFQAPPVPTLHFHWLRLETVLWAAAGGWVQALPAAHRFSLHLTTCRTWALKTWVPSSPRHCLEN